MFELSPALAVMALKSNREPCKSIPRVPCQGRGLAWHNRHVRRRSVGLSVDTLGHIISIHIIIFHPILSPSLPLLPLFFVFKNLMKSTHTPPSTQFSVGL